MEFALTSSTGLSSLFLMAVIVAIPFVTRWIRKRLGSHSVNYPAAMSVHQWSGYILLVVAVIHMYASMGGGMAMHVNPVGLNAATLALLLLLVQITLGITRPQGHADSGFLVWRRMHFIVMLGIVALVAVHIWLNGMLIYRLL